MAAVPKLNTLHLVEKTPFKVVAPFEPMGDQKKAIKDLAAGIENGQTAQVLLGATGTGKTFTGLGVIKRMVLQGKKNILVVSPTADINKQWIDTAKEFLIELLNTVEKMSSKEVQAQAKEAGFSPASIRRAQERLNIKPFRPHGEKGWFWSLPKIHRLDEPSNF